MGEVVLDRRPAIAHGAAWPSDAFPSSLGEALQAAVARRPNGAFIHIGADGALVRRSYRDTFDLATRILGGLREAGFKPGDAVVAYLAEAADFVPASWAILLGGGVLVPLMRRPRNRRHAQGVAENLRRLRADLPGCWLVTDLADDAVGPALILRDLQTAEPADAARTVDPEAPRLLVMTSGTTTVPRLVALSERAVLARWWAPVPAADEMVCFLTWSPFDHIMGIGAVSPSQPCKVTLAADRFAAQPMAWLDAIEEHRVTNATMTNSGLAMIENAVAASHGQRWDLSSLRKLGVGAEAISPRLCRRFMMRLAPHGLAGDAMILGYGLTECGPIAGGADSFRPAEGDPAAVPLDRPTGGHSVRIVDADGALLGEGEVGLVEVRGVTMASGYHGDSEASRALFTSDGWLRTGDLGRLTDDRLTITGREKEQIAILGVKYACPAIEAVAEAVAGVRAAYAVSCRDRRRGREDLSHFAVFVTLEDGADAAEAEAAVAEAISAAFGLAPTAVVAIEPEAVPLTPSGKVRRQDLSDALDAGRFDKVRAAETRSDTLSERESVIAAIWAEVLGFSGFGPDEDFFAIGGDSLAAVRMALAVEAAFGGRLPDHALHERTTVRGLAILLDGVEPAVRSHFSPDVEARLRVFLRDWSGAEVEPDGLLRGLNVGAPGRPWFWCVQEDYEMRALADIVGPSHPLYAMRSGMMAMTYTPEAIDGLARRYLREVVAVDPTGPYLIGGECQGSLVAHAMARKLQAEGRNVALLALVDTDFWSIFDGRPYPGRVACFAGARSRFNPTRLFRQPERGWSKLIPAGVRLMVLPGDHHDILAPPAAPILAQAVRDAVTWSEEPRPDRPAGPSGPWPREAYFARITAPPHLRLRPGQRARVTVNITNTSPVEWSADAGVALGNHWMTPTGELAVFSDGRTWLPHPIAPGQAADVEIEIQAPAREGRYLVEFDLVDEGVSWFKVGNDHCGFTEAMVSRWTPPWRRRS